MDLHLQGETQTIILVMSPVSAAVFLRVNVLFTPDARSLATVIPAIAASVHTTPFAVLLIN